MRYFIELQYKGTNYHGWQIQPNAISIQSTIQDALQKLLGHEVEVVGAGRTDTGVHASYYVAHFDTDKAIDSGRIAYSLDRTVPFDISILSISPVSPEAHSRYSAISRTYKYYINRRKNPFTTETSTYIWGPIDIDLMNEAGRKLFLHTDFTSFSKVNTDTLTNICEIKHARWEETGNTVVFTISADRFLRNMVRAIVGTMLEVGRHKISIEQFEDIIVSQDRCRAGMSVPPQGLFLHDIQYPESIFARKNKPN